MQTHPYADLRNCTSNCTRTYTNATKLLSHPRAERHNNMHSQTQAGMFMETEPQSLTAMHKFTLPHQSHSLYNRHDRLDPRTLNEF